MMSNVFMKSLWDQRKSLIWWGLGFAVLMVVTILFYPSVSDTPELNELLGDETSIIRAFVGDISDMTSPEGYLNSQLYFLMVPLLVLVFAISRGSGAIAGEEESGTLDLLLSNPQSRSKVVVHKFAAMVVAITMLGIVLWLSAVIGAIFVDMDVSFVKLGEVTLSAAFLGATFGALALMLSCATGKRNLSIGVASAIGVATYFLNALVPLVDVLEPLTRLSPFYYYIDADPLTNGLSILNALVLAGLSSSMLIVALITFDRRDLAV
jgi:ABC-2 type transport system permease protein